MKKFIVAAVAAVCALGVSAQRASDTGEFSFWDGDKTEQKIVIGPRVGLNISTLSMKEGNYSYSPDSKVGFNAGVAVEFPIVRSFYVNTGLFYTTKGCKIKDDGDEEKINLGYLSLPLYASYRLNFAEQSQLQVNFGPYFAYGVNGKDKYTDSDGDKYEQDAFGTKEGQAGLKRFDCGLGFGLGYTFNRIYLGLEYQLGLTNIADKKVWDNDTSIKTRNFSISVGYNF